MEVRPGYKTAEVGVIPHDWEVKQLAALAQMGSGGTPLSSVPAYYGGEIPWVSIADITRAGKFIETTEKTLTPLGLTNSAARMFPAGTVLYAMYASLGECSIAGVPVCTSQAILGIRPNARLDDEYLYYVLTSIRSTVKTLGQQGTQANLNKGMVQAFYIGIPSPEEQRAIAEALSDVDALLAGLDRLIAKKRDLKDAAMQQLLTGQIRLPGFHGEWEEKSLGTLGAWRGGMTPSMQNRSYWQGGDFPWISSGDVKVSRLSDTSQHVTAWAVRCGAAVVVPTNSIVLVTRSGILRKYFPVALVERPMAINQDLKALIPNDKVSADFLLHALTGWGDAILAKCLKAGTTVESVEFPWLKAFSIPIPPRDEQVAISAVLADLGKELAALEARRGKTRDLKQAMMQELLTGKTRLVHGEMVNV